MMKPQGESYILSADGLCIGGPFPYKGAVFQTEFWTEKAKYRRYYVYRIKDGRVIAVEDPEREEIFMGGKWRKRL